VIPNWLTELRQLTASLSASLADRYRIERELGAGGMATVYLAHDLKHDRDVAIKVLRPELAAVIGAERFLSEIKTTANLQHPHILPLFDSGEADGFLFYVMPFIEGESLRNRLAREKQLPITDAVRIATEVAGALDYAHRHNVIHRDIKPENILLHDGRALAADFGIALAAQEARGARMTQTGLSLGTPQYMSPEQAMGERQIDGRTDVYALGAMLYEMLTGEPPFGGASGQAIVAKMMTERPTPPSTVRETVPDAVEAAVLTALAKLPADRFTSAAQFADALAVAEARGPAAESRARSSRAARSHVRLAAIALAALLIGVAAGFWGSWLRRPRADEGVLRTMIAFPSGQELEAAPQGNSFVLSRDGSVLVYWGRATGDIHQLWSRRLDQLNATPIRGTEGGVLPVLSPDGRQVAFETLTDRKIRVVPIEGGVPRIVVDSARRGGVDWAADGMLYYRATSDGLSRVPAAGGASEKLTQSGTDAGVGGIGYFWPQALPRGRSLIASFRPSSGDDAASRIVAIPLETGKPIDIVAGVYARYAPTGHLVWATADGTVYAAPFNARTFALGAPTLLLEHVRVESAFGSADFSFSDHGRLLYQLGDASGGDLVWVSRAGTIVPLGVDGMQAGLGAGMRVSPDGRSLAVSRVFGTELDVWVKSLPDGALTRLTTSGSPNLWPAWTPDGRYVSFLRRGALYKRAADGTGTDSLVLRRPTAIRDAAWSPDGQWLALDEALSRLVLLRRGDSTVRALSEGARFAEAEPRFSPDSRWLAYTSVESGQSEVYVRPFPDVNAGKWQVSLGGGTSPRWSHTGHELFYRTKGSARLMSATISTSPTFSIVRRDSLTPAATQAVGFNAEALEVGANDQQFLVIRSRGQGQGLVIVEHWFDDLLHNARP
jgi:serine/threonine-protein kinase